MDKYQYHIAAQRSDQDRNMEKYQCFRAAERPDQDKNMNKQALQSWHVILNE